MLAVPSFSHLFTSSHLPDAFGRRMGAMLLVARLSGNSADEKFGWPQVLKRVLELSRNLGTLKHVAIAVGAEIDDRLDNMSFEKMQQLGEIRQGVTPCAFVKNPEVVTAEDWVQFKELDRANILPFPATVAFANALAAKVYAEKESCHLAQGNPEGRLEAKRNHLELSALSLAFIGAVINPVQARRMADNAEHLSYEFVAAAMPDLVHYGKILQIHDDLSDLLKDKREEEVLDVVSPNVVLADMAQGEAFGELEEYVAIKGDKLPVGEFTGINKFPAAVRLVWQDTVAAAIEIAGQVGDARSAKCMRAMFSGLPGPMVPQLKT